MTNIITLKKGLESSRLSITPASGEAIYTTDDKKVYIGDGVTAGGNPVGGGNAGVEAVATGALSNGSKVILNSDGTVEVVAQTVIPEAIPAGSASVFNSANTQHTSCAFDPNTAGKFVIVYMDQGNNGSGTAIVGTVSGTTISFGAEYVFNSGDTRYNSISFDPNTPGKFVISYNDIVNSNYGTAIVGTVSGTTISYGAEYVFNSGMTHYVSCAFDPNTAGMFVVAYRDLSTSGRAIVGTVTGTTISFGAEYVFNSGDSQYNSLAFDPNTAGKFVVSYRDNGNSYYGTAIVGTVSGTTLSFGAEYVFESTGNGNFISCSFDPNTAGQFVIAYCLNYTIGTAIVGTVSGTTIAYSTKYTFESLFGWYPDIAFDPNTAGKFVIAYRDYIDPIAYGRAIVGTIIGTSISFGSEYTFNSGDTNWVSIDFDPNTTGQFVISYLDESSVLYGTAVIGVLELTTTNLTSDNFIGISDGAYLTTELATIQVVGATNYAQLGLTPALKYYVQGDGTLSTTPDTPSVYAGKALSATNLIIKG